MDAIYMFVGKLIVVGLGTTLSVVLVVLVTGWLLHQTDKTLR